MVYHRYYPEENFSFVVFYGDVANGELGTLTDQVLISGYKEGVRHLSVACQSFSVLKLEMKDVYNSARRIRDQNFKVDGRGAFVADSTLAFGMLRAFQISIDADETMVTRRDQLSEAIHWLGVTGKEQEITELVERFECEVT